MLKQEGFIWILLDGGPSRAFSESDVEHMHEDLTILKVRSLSFELI